MCSVPQMAVLGGCGPKNWANSTWVICRSGATCARDPGEMASKPMASDCGDEREYQSLHHSHSHSNTVSLHSVSESQSSHSTQSQSLSLHTPLSLRVLVLMVGDSVEGKPWRKVKPWGKALP